MRQVFDAAPQTALGHVSRHGRFWLKSKNDRNIARTVLIHDRTFHYEGARGFLSFVQNAGKGAASSIASFQLAVAWYISDDGSTTVLH